MASSNVSRLLLFFLSLQFIYLPVLCKILVNNEKFEIVQWGLLNYPTSNETLELVSQAYGNLTGKIAYILSPTASITWRQFTPLIESLKEKGCIGVITYPSNYRENGYFMYGQISNDGFVLPVGMISKYTYDYIIEQNEQVINFTFLEWDPNPWDYMFTGANYIGVRVVMTTMFSLNVILATYQLSCWFYTIGKVEFSIGISCLIIEWICNVMRVIQSILTPLFNIYHLPVIDIITSMATCLSLISSLLVVFFWLDLTTDHFYHGKFLGIMKKPAIIFISFCVGFEILEEILRTVVNNGTIAQVVTIVYLVFQTIISIFYFVAAKKICRARKDKSLIKVTIRIIFSGICTLLSWIFIGLYLSSVIYYPVGFVVVWLLLFVSFFAQSFFLIIAFQVPKGNISSSGSLSPKSVDSSVTSGEEKEMI